MKSRNQRVLAVTVITAFVLFALVLAGHRVSDNVVIAQEKPKSDSDKMQDFDQKAALAKLREQIKGKEQEPAEKVFKNIQITKGFPAGRVLAIMEFGFSRSLGVDCTHCHTPGNWASETKSTKQIARDMWNMQAKINGELLTNIEGLKDRRAFVNCTTCHRGDVKPATNLPMPPKPESEKKTRSETKSG